MRKPELIGCRQRRGRPVPAVTSANGGISTGVLDAIDGMVVMSVGSHGERIRRALVVLSVALVLAVFGLFSAAAGGAVRDGGSSPAETTEQLQTATSVPISGFLKARKGEILAAKLDGVLHLSGMTAHQAEAFIDATGRTCTRGIQLDSEGPGDDRTVTRLSDLLAGLGCDVSGYVLVLKDSGQLSGTVGTTDSAAMSSLRAKVGAGVEVLYDHSGYSPGPGGA